jgi:TRAP-type C4-dicarboxylate transport system substrate-binding protein
MNKLKSVAFAAMLSVFGTAATAEDVINAVHFTPVTTDMTKEFLAYVDAVNTRGKGIVRIDVKGGPEVIPNPQLGTAQQSGLIDMIHTPAGLYLELVPEGEVLSASSLPPAEARKNGAWDFIDSIYQQKGNAKLLAHMNASAQFHLWTVDEPKLNADGMLDFSGLLVRASPLYKQFFENLGATMIIQPAPEVYTSLERGVINSTAYPIIGFEAFGWDKFTKYRIDPGFFRLDVLISMNKDAWEALSPEAQKIVGETAAEFEQKSYDEAAALAKMLAQRMVDKGQKVVTMTGAGKDKFLQVGADASWQRMEARDATHIAKLKELFQ